MLTFKRSMIDEALMELSDVVETVEEKIRNSVLTAIEIIITPRIELAIRSMNATSGWNTASVTSISERGEQTMINASFENLSARYFAFQEIKNTDRIRGYNFDDNVSFCSQGRILTGNHTVITQWQEKITN